MALFGRKAKPAETPQTDDREGNWALGQGEVNGRPLIARWDIDAKQTCPDETRPVKVTIGVGYDHPQANGLPSARDNDYLAAMEDTLFAELPGVADTQPVLVLTTNGMREWIIYSATHEWLESWAPTFQKRFLKGRPGKIEAAREPGWQTFQEWSS